MVQPPFACLLMREFKYFVPKRRFNKVLSKETEKENSHQFFLQFVHLKGLLATVMISIDY